MKTIDKFNKIRTEKRSTLCVGLDPDLSKIPAHLTSDPEALFTFSREIIRTTADYAAAYKINFAFFETHGSAGWRTIEKLMAEIPSNCLSIADAKRGDIGNSAMHYANAILDKLNFDAVTVNPYMGKDAATPFLDYKDKLIIFLGLTSNPGAQDFQYFGGDVPLYQHVAQTVEKWNEHKNCGLVVGATRPEQLGEIRGMAPSLTFLIPGIGAQGGTIERVFRHLGDANALISASRSVLYASGKTDFADAAREEARRLQQEIATHLTD